MLIVGHHIFFAAGTTSNSSSWGRFTGRLDVGVPIFFVLSGFLLFRPFVASILSGQDFPSIKNFVFKRFLRIFPAYWLALIVLLSIGAVVVNGATGFLFSFFLLHVYHPYRAITGITQSWSLATEIAFYALLPFLALMLRRLSAKRTTNQRAIVVALSLGGLYVFSLLFRLVIHLANPWWARITPVWLPAQIDIFALGMFVALLSEWAKKNPSIRKLNLSIAHKVSWAFTLAAGSFVVMSTQFDLAVGLETASFISETLRQATYGLIGVLIVAPFALGEGSTKWHLLFGLKPVAWVGLVSYGIYIWHQILISGHFAERHMPYTLFDGGILDRFAWGLASSLLLASLSYYLLEEPLSRLYVKRQKRR